MKKRIQIHLKTKDREILDILIRKGKEKARKLTRCRILLLSDKKVRNSKISEMLGVTLFTIRQIQKRYEEEGLTAAIEERARPGKPPKFDGKQQAKITAMACSTPPEGHSRWTLRLLANRVVELNIVENISYKTVGELLKKQIKASPKKAMVYHNCYS
jgi:transposase